ncbi:hypothetical protein L1F28_16955 [Arthrospira platensis NCB002]|uniref:hypothetical protein n=1 Tax=Limnospira platensis TaxID=118562 RepID=UPI002978236F|nr:hypothetical protein [Arthrospira platensis NCB002]
MPIRLAMRPTGGGGGGAYYRHIKSGYFQLTAGEEIEIVPATPLLVRREITIQADNPFSIRWVGSDLSLPVFENGFYSDGSDGGIGVLASSPTTQILSIWVRQDTEIDYNIGSEIEDDMPIPDLSIRPFISLDSNINKLPSFISSDSQVNYDDVDTYNRFWGTWTTTEGAVRAWQFDVFLPGKQYVFNITNNLYAYIGNDGISTSVIKEGTNIEILLFPRETMWMAISQVALFSNVFSSYIDIDNLEKWITDRCSIVTVPHTGGAFNLTPTLSRYILLFKAEGSFLAPGLGLCRCIYTPNSTDPKQGGEFEITQFLPWEDW